MVNDPMNIIPKERKMDGMKMDTEENERIDEEKLEKFLATVDWEKIHRRDRMKSDFKCMLNLNQTRKRSEDILDFFEDDEMSLEYKFEVVRANLQRSENILKRMIKIFPQSVDLHTFLVFTLSELDKADEVLSEYERANDTIPDNSSILNNYAMELSETGRYQEAEIYYKRAIELEPDLSISYNNLAYMYEEMERYQDALLMFERAHELDPEDEDYLERIKDLKKTLNEYDVQ